MVAERFVGPAADESSYVPAQPHWYHALGPKVEGSESSLVNSDCCPPFPCSDRSISELGANPDATELHQVRHSTRPHETKNLMRKG